MLQPFVARLNAERIILASGSPRRKEILQNIGLRFEVIPSQFEENLDKSSFDYPYEYVKGTALSKALDICNSLNSSDTIPFLIISADTVVAMDKQIFEKPQDKKNAVEMLSLLSGQIHTVYTGVALLTPFPAAFADRSLSDERRFNVDLFHAATEVEFDKLDAETIEAYVESGEPMDKAGGYGIQALGGTLVKGIRGDYFNVMGFPLNLFATHLADICKAKWR